MALAGTLTVTGPTFDGATRYYHLSWTATQNIAKNTSTVTWTISCSGYSPNNWSYLAERRGYATLAGQVIWNKSDRVNRQPGTIATGTITIPHDANGNASFSTYLEVSIYDADWIYSGTATYTLDRIFRGVVHIDSGTALVEYACYIDNGTSFGMYQPYIDNGTSWEMY